MARAVFRRAPSESEGPTDRRPRRTIGAYVGAAVAIVAAALLL